MLKTIRRSTPIGPTGVNVAGRGHPLPQEAKREDTAEQERDLVGKMVVGPGRDSERGPGDEAPVETVTR